MVAPRLATGLLLLAGAGSLLWPGGAPGASEHLAADAMFARPFPPAGGEAPVDGVVPVFAQLTSGEPMALMVAASRQEPAPRPRRRKPRKPVMPLEGTLPACGYFHCPRPGHLHNGLDITAPEGTPVRAALEGRVALVAPEGTAGSSGYGNLVCIQHRARLATCYAHLSRFGPAALEGDVIHRGERVGDVGSTGQSTGPHLHFEVRRGPAGCQECAFDPRVFLNMLIAPRPIPSRRELGLLSVAPAPVDAQPDVLGSTPALVPAIVPPLPTPPAPEDDGISPPPVARAPEAEDAPAAPAPAPKAAPVPAPKPPPVAPAPAPKPPPPPAAPPAPVPAATPPGDPGTGGLSPR